MLNRLWLCFSFLNHVQDPPYTEDDEKSFKSWIFKDEVLSEINSCDELRSRLFPSPSFLSEVEKGQLEKELMMSVYPKYCICQTVLGETKTKMTLIACDADGGCRSHRWFHTQCMNVDKSIIRYVCPECSK